MLVDREEETVRLLRLVTDVSGGPERLGVISGAASSGKTELLAHVCRKAAADGLRLLSAAASPAEQGFPYAVLEQLLQGVPEHHTNVAPSFPAAGAEDGTEADADAAEVPAAVLRDVHRVLTTLTDDAPLLIAVDDIQFADPQSVRCLAHVLRRIPPDALRVIVTRGLRPGTAGGAATAALDELLHGPQVCHIRIGPLTEEGVRRLVADRLGAARAAGPAPAFHASTGGNPLLVHGLLDDHASADDHVSATDDGTAHEGGSARDDTSAPDHGAPRTCEMFQQAALVCVHRSGADALRVAHGVALLGRVRSVPLLGRLVGLDESAVRRAVTDLTEAGILHDGGFRHEAVRTALVEDLPCAEISGLRRLAARLLHENGAAPTAVARQLLNCPPDTDEAPVTEEWVARVLRDAAREAIAGDRITFAMSCLQLAERHCADGPERLVIRSTLAQIIWRVKPLAWAQQVMSLAGAAREGLLPPAHALGVAAGLLWSGCAEDAAAIMSRVAGTVAETSDPGLRGELLLARLTMACTFPGAAELLETPAEQHRNREEPTADPSPRHTALRALQAVLVRGADAGAIAAAEQVLETVPLSDKTVNPLRAALMTLVYADALNAASTWCDRLLAESVTRQAPGWRANFSAIRGLVALRRGQLSDAVEYAEKSLEYLPARGWGVAVGLPLSVLVEARTAMGHHETAAELLSRPVPEPMFRSRYGLHYLYARGRHQLATGRHYAALTDFRLCEEQMGSWGLDSPTLAPWRVGAAETWLLLENPEQAGRLAEEQLSRSGAARTRTRGMALRVLAASRPLAERPAILDRAVDLLQQGGDWYESARALADLGRTHEALGDPSRGRLLVRRAWRIADGCNAEELSRSLLPPPVRGAPAESAGASARADSTAVSSLTDAERRVASLAAYGYTNREIAAKLFITVSTVEQHLTRVYRKINISQRQDLPISLDTDVAYTA